jgi:hypothetical protein
VQVIVVPQPGAASIVAIPTWYLAQKPHPRAESI